MLWDCHSWAGMTHPERSHGLKQVRACSCASCVVSQSLRLERKWVGRPWMFVTLSPESTMGSNALSQWTVLSQNMQAYYQVMAIKHGWVSCSGFNQQMSRFELVYFTSGDFKEKSTCDVCHQNNFTNSTSRTTQLLDIYPKDAPPSHKDTCSTMFASALLITTRNWK